MSKRNNIKNRLSGIRFALAPALLLLACMFLATSCSSGFNPFKKADKTAVPPPGTGVPVPGSATGTISPQPASGRSFGAGPTGADQKKKKKKGLEIDRELIEEAGLESFSANFNKEVGRDDPFETVTISSSMGVDQTKVTENPDIYRVLGTARTPTGMIAMLQIDTDSPIVHEGDILDSGAVVKKINTYSVVIEDNGQEVIFSMRTRKREASSVTTQEASQQMLEMLKNPQVKNNLDNLYDSYLKAKYLNNEKSSKESSPESDGGGEAASRDSMSFQDFVNKTK